MRTSWSIWHCLNEETREKLRLLTTSTWHPPAEHSDIYIEPMIEGLTELTKIMKQKPRNK